MTLAQDKQTIRKAMAYRSGADSCNSVYLGSLATSMLYDIVGVPYGHGDFETALKKADRKVVDRLLSKCRNVIDYMQKNPVKKCPCCGQIVPQAD